MAIKKKHKTKKPTTCYFCENESAPDYKETLIIKRFISDRGKVVAASRSGVCSRHQRVLSKTIKKSRFMALTPYTDKHAL